MGQKAPNAWGAEGEIGYGLPVGSRFVGTPRVGLTTSEYGRDYRRVSVQATVDTSAVLLILPQDLVPCSPASRSPDCAGVAR